MSTAIWIGGEDGTSDNSDIVLGTCREHLLIRFCNLGAGQQVHALTDRKAVVSLRENCHVNLRVGEDVLEICQCARILDHGHQHDLVIVPSGVIYERVGVVVSSAYREANTPITFLILEGSVCGLLAVLHWIDFRTVNC